MIVSECLVQLQSEHSICRPTDDGELLCLCVVEAAGRDHDFVSNFPVAVLRLSGEGDLLVSLVSRGLQLHP